ncbi:tyrosine-type recombinase/integrase [Salipaludibacillus sp. CF4.18]|uniref:tyrosine-type recombinase/integrase n=1 Tax=Salipaludibacillus sp. CF4.18 TaxID=3373081 RepID=UPI003EE5070E
MSFRLSPSPSPYKSSAFLRKSGNSSRIPSFSIGLRTPFCLTVTPIILVLDIFHSTSNPKAQMPYGFRHTHAVLLLESGASLKYVANRLGHKTIKTTADTYLDITEKIEEDELQKFASYTKR